jgi:hypothetical protein
MGMKEIRKVLEGIEVVEVREGAEEAVTIMNTAPKDYDRKAARQTYVALARFGSHLKDRQIKPRFQYPEANEEGETLKSVITQSEIAYFGPMFKHGGMATPLHDRDKITKEMNSRGYHTGPLSHLTDEQLDMLFTKTLESGLLSDFTNLQPSL